MSDRGLDTLKRIFVFAIDICELQFAESDELSAVLSRVM